MREIKFRAIIAGRNATIYFDLTDLVHPARKDLFSKRELLIPWLLAGNIPDEFTGLKDSKGCEIYEGDIVELLKQETPSSLFIRSLRITVKWSEQGLNYNIWSPAVGEKWEVIGNIYENPELVK